MRGHACNCHRCSRFEPRSRRTRTAQPITTGRGGCRPWVLKFVGKDRPDLQQSKARNVCNCYNGRSYKCGSSSLDDACTRSLETRTAHRARHLDRSEIMRKLWLRIRHAENSDRSQCEHCARLGRQLLLTTNVSTVGYLDRSICSDLIQDLHKFR